MGWFFSRKPKLTDQVFVVYNAIVAQSRQARFFAEWSVPDTVTGRFDMLSLHMCLVLRRLRSKDDDIKAFSQELFDLFFKDMDRSLREMGISDVALPKRIEAMGELFYGLLEAVTKALSDVDVAEGQEGDAPTLEDVLVKNILSGNTSDNAKSLTQYVNDQAAVLDKISLDDLKAGRFWQTAPEHKGTPQ